MVNWHVLFDLRQALTELSWQAELGFDDIVKDTWRWQSKNPNGYDD